MLSKTERSRHQRSSKQLALKVSVNTITALEPVAPAGKAVRLYINNIPWRTTATRVAKGLGLTVGKEVQLAALEAGVLEGEKALAIELAMQSLSYRARSRQELRDKLGARKLTKDVIDATIAVLEKAGYLDDGKFARAWTKDRVQRRAYGSLRIRNELFNKGVRKETVNKALESLYPIEKERETARLFVDKVFPKYAGLDRFTASRRLVQALLRRGFGQDIAEEVISETMKSHHGAEPAQ